MGGLVALSEKLNEISDKLDEIQIQLEDASIRLEDIPLKLTVRYDIDVYSTTNGVNPES